MNGLIDVHNLDNRLKQQWKLIDGSGITKANREDIRRFYEFCLVNGIREATRLKYIYNLRRIAELSGKNFRDMTRDDILKVIAGLKESKRCFCPTQWITIGMKENGKPLKKLQRVNCGLKVCGGKAYSTETVNDFRKCISKFFRWIYDLTDKGDPKPTLLKGISMREKVMLKEPSMHSAEDGQKIIDGATSVRNKALMALFQDIPLREEEVLTRKIKHVSEFNDDGDRVLNIEASKSLTARKEPLYTSAPYIKMWLQIHPLRNDPEAPLWIMTKKNGECVPMSYAALRKIFREICDKQGIKNKKLHTFRATTANRDILNGVPAHIVKSRGGWSKNSNVFEKRYLNSSEAQKREAYNKFYGRSSKENPSEIDKPCINCDSPLKKLDSFCPRCGYPTTDKANQERREARKIDVTKLISPEMLDELVKKHIIQMLKQERGEKHE